MDETVKRQVCGLLAVMPTLEVETRGEGYDYDLLLLCFENDGNNMKIPSFWNEKLEKFQIIN